MDLSPLKVFAIMLIASVMSWVFVGESAFSVWISLAAIGLPILVAAVNDDSAFDDGSSE